MSYRYLVLLASLILLAGCHRIPQQEVCNSKIIICKKSSNAEQQSSPYSIQPSPIITVWIHGTRAFFSKFICRDFFYSRRGFHCATDFEFRYHVREIAELLQNNAPHQFCANDFYFYGWSGKLSFKSRYKAARKLYKHLCSLVNDYEKEFGIRPKLRIITHSHGGNVALNLAHFNIDCQLLVDELILLACPVQKRTCHLSEHETFKKIYSLYSRFDSFQILDPQQIYYWLKKDLAEPMMVKPDSFFSQRRFPDSNKIRQVQLKLNNSGIMHIGFLTNKFIGVLPAIIEEIDSWESDDFKGTTELLIKLI